MAATEDLTRLTTFQHHVDDMRNLVMCKICLKPLYEPFILACGHTYCYGCLRSWFSGQPTENRRRKKNCPDCRAEVKLTPSPNYILRDLVHMFIGRAELLPEDETVDEHVAGKIAEAELLASDKDGKGIFQGVFRSSHHHPFPAFGPLQDVADGVLRCPDCYWELEDGRCEQCGYEIDDDSYLDFSDDGESGMDEEQSIPSDISSLDTDSYAARRGIPHHFYGARSLADDVDPSIATDPYSEDYDSSDNRFAPNRFAPASEDDEMEGFIDDNEEDEPDEVDEDDMGPPLYGYPPVPRRYHYRIPDSDEDDDDDEDEDEDTQVDDDEEEEDEEEDETVHNHYHRHSGWAETVDGSTSEEDSEEQGDENQDQQTNYDESDEEESRSSTPVARNFPRRRAIVISDDEDEDEDEDVHPNPSGVEFNVADSSRTEETEKDGSDDSESDATATTPQPSSSRRQRLDNHRKRRRPTSAWRALVRGGNQDTSNDRRERQSAASWLHEGRGGRRTNMDVLVGPGLSP